MNFTNFKKYSNKLFLILRFIFKCFFSIAAAILISIEKSSKINRDKIQAEEEEDIDFYNSNKKRPML